MGPTQQELERGLGGDNRLAELAEQCAAMEAETKTVSARLVDFAQTVSALGQEGNFSNVLPHIEPAAIKDVEDAIAAAMQALQSTPSGNVPAPLPI
jgi:hypothetical protein